MKYFNYNLNLKSQSQKHIHFKILSFYSDRYCYQLLQFFKDCQRVI